jgi:hypothetical protein
MLTKQYEKKMNTQSEKVHTDVIKLFTKEETSDQVMGAGEQSHQELVKGRLRPQSHV